MQKLSTLHPISFLSLSFVFFFSIQCASKSSFQSTNENSEAPGNQVSFLSPASEATYEYILGEIAHQQSKPLEAYQHFRAAALNQPESSFLRLKQAEQLVALGRIAEASVVLESIEDDAKDADFYLLRSRLHPLPFEVEAANEDLSAAIRLFEESGKDQLVRETRLLQVAVLSDAEQFEQALEILKLHLEENPSDEVALYFQGKIYSVLSRLEEAKKSYHLALQVNPHFTAAARSLGLIYEAELDLASATQVYENILISHTDDVELREKLINLYISAEQYEKAIPHVDFLSLYYPNNIQNVLRAGLIHFKLNQYDEAKALFEKLLNQSMVDQDRVLFYLGALFEQQEKFSEAIEYFSKVSIESRYYIDSQLQASKIEFENLGQMNAANDRLMRAILARPESREFYLTLASYYDQMNDSAHAVRVLYQSTRQFPKDEELLFVLGTYLDRSGDYEAGIRSMREVLEINPNNAFALNHIGYVYAERKINLAEAEELLLRAVQLEPQNAFIIDSLGWLYHQKEKYQKSKEFLEKAIALAPNEPEILEHLADVYRKVGRSEEALELYQKAVSLMSDDTIETSNKERAKNNERLLEKIALVSESLEENY